MMTMTTTMAKIVILKMFYDRKPRHVFKDLTFFFFVFFICGRSSGLLLLMTIEGDDCGDAEKMFRCDEAQCIDVNSTCNGVTECRNGRDESIPVCGCQVDEFQCNSTTCVDVIKRCDRTADCQDGVDELGCDMYSCPPTHIKCQNDFCVPRDEECNFVDDCGDNSDESSCAYPECYDTEWTCSNSQCIPGTYLCDGTDDCFDGSDEVNCHAHVRCENGLFVSSRHRCDGWVDCTDSQTDEEQCGPCSPDQYRCLSSRCISESNRCDSVCDCENGCDDEKNCSVWSPGDGDDDSYQLLNPSSSSASPSSSAPTWSCLLPPGLRFVCPAREEGGRVRCVDRKYVCNARNDCWDTGPGSDEQFCVANQSECRSVWCDGGLCLSNKTIVCPFVDSYDSQCQGQPIEAVKDVELFDADDTCSAETGSCFTCRNGRCIPQELRCDGVIDCLDMSDELECRGRRCPPGSRQCDVSGQCVLEDRWCDFNRNCLDGSDEDDCPKSACADDEFRCRSQQCVKTSELCLRSEKEADIASGGGGGYGRGRRGGRGCADNSHLLNCSDFICPDGWFKCRNSYCVPQSVKCDYFIDCRTTHTDEQSCPYPCPYPEDACSCLETMMNCTARGLSRFPSITDERGVHHKILFSHNRLNESLDQNTFQDLGHVKFLDISWNSIQNLPPDSFQPLWRLTTLSLAHNKLRHLYNGTFRGLSNVNVLHLHGNEIERIDPFSFLGLSSLKTLDLSRQSIRGLPKHAFCGLRSVYTLNLSQNAIAYISGGAFNGLQRLKVIDISRNQIANLDAVVFSGLNSLQTLRTDEFRFCCLATGVTTCWPPPDEFSSCEDLMSNFVLRVCIWALGLLSLVGNSVVIVWRLRDTRDNRVHSFLITNMATGDLLMGIYLLIIACVDFNYRGVYGAFDATWRMSALCRFAGFLSTYSSEISVLTLAVITLDRFVSIIFPFRIRRLGMREARVVMATLWGAVLFLAALPLVGFGYFENFYGRSGVCLALHITPDKPAGWEYSVFVFLALNFVLFLVISVSYLWMFFVAKRTHLAARSTQVKTDRAMARRMTLIVLTDFFCWIPIILLGVASLNGATIPPQTFAWVAVFVLPLNAAINPLLYTLSTTRFVGHARRRVFKFRKSFISSLAGMADTKPTLVSTDENFAMSPPDERGQSSKDISLSLIPRSRHHGHLPQEPYPGKIDTRHHHHPHVIHHITQLQKQHLDRHRVAMGDEEDATRHGRGRGGGGREGREEASLEVEEGVEMEEVGGEGAGNGFDQQSNTDSRPSTNNISSSYETIESLN